MNDEFFLNTTRLKIRYFNKSDYLDLYEYLSDMRTYKYEPGNSIAIDESKEFCIKRSNSKIFFAVELKTEKKQIGHIYFNILIPESLLTYEIGYIFNQKYHENGYATEAIKDFIKVKFSEPDIHKIISHCNPKNKPSWKLLERLEFKREGKLRKNIFFRKDGNNNPIWLDTYEYGLLVEDIVQETNKQQSINN